METYIYTGAKTNSSYFTLSDYIECSGFDYLAYSKMITAADNTQLGLAFYDSTKTALRIGSGMFYSNTTESVTGYMSIPENAKYLRYAYPLQQNIVNNSLPDCFIRLYKINDASQRMGRTDGLDTPANGLYFRKPHSKGVENVINRLHQMSQIKWTPIEDCPRMLFDYSENVIRTKFNAGVEYTGVPYSVSYGKNNNIGIEKSIYSFITASRHAKSRQFDESMYTYSQYAYIGNVCSSYVSMAFGLKCEPLTKDMPNFIWFNKIAPSSVYNENTLLLGDILLSSSHVACVSGILCDSNGVIKLIEISEETLAGYIMSGKAVSKWYSPEQFSDVWIGSYSLYRFKYIDDVQYNPSDFSQVFPEGASYVNATKYCCPVYGDRSVMSVSDTPLDIGISDDAYLSGCRTINVYKNGELIQTSSIDDSGDPVTVSREIGSYFASVLDSNNKVIETLSWDVIDGVFTKSSSENTWTVTYDTDNELYAIEYKVTGDNDIKYIPFKPVTGTGSKQFSLSSNASVIGVIIGNTNGAVHLSI